MTRILCFLALATYPPALFATVLTFNNPSGIGFGNGSFIPAAYGDRVTSTVDAVGSYLQGNGYTPNVQVSQGRFDSSGTWITEQVLRSYDANYGDLVNVVFAASSLVGGIGLKFEADAGWSILLNRVSFAGWERQDRPIRLQVLNDVGLPIADSGLVTAPETVSAFSPPLSAVRFYISSP